MAETAKGTVEVTDPTRAQVAVARRMAESKATVPDTALMVEADFSAVDGDPLVAIVHACALALREHPRVNGAYRDARFESYSRVNIGVAVDAQEALVVPVIFDADGKSPAAIATELAALRESARDGSITASALAGATFTVLALDALRVVPILNAPQAAILGLGAVEERAVVRDGEVVAGKVAQLTLVSDHRIVYGTTAAAFLRSVQAAIAGA